MPRRARPEWDKVAAARIAEERARLALSQQRMADELGVDRKTVGRWESGDTSPEAAQLQNLALAGWDVQYILTGQRRATSARVSQEAAWLLATWNGLSDRQRMAFRVLLDDCAAVRDVATYQIHDIGTE